jgi:hypothetical protein
MDDFEKNLIKQYARVVAYTLAIAGGLVLAVGFTIMPALSDLAGQLVGLGCGVTGIVGAWTIEIVRQKRAHAHR